MNLYVSKQIEQKHQQKGAGEQSRAKQLQRRRGSGFVRHFALSSHDQETHTPSNYAISIPLCVCARARAREYTNAHTLEQNTCSKGTSSRRRFVSTRIIGETRRISAPNCLIINSSRRQSIINAILINAAKPKAAP